MVCQPRLHAGPDALLEHAGAHAHQAKGRRLRFPGDPAAANLAHWQVLENENPGTFVGMYQFWVQKR